MLVATALLIGSINMMLQQHTLYKKMVATPRLALLVSGLLLSSCATLTPQQCQQGDWYAIGYHDGTNGRKPTYVGNHFKACSKLNIRPNPHTWENGRQEGLKRYCTPLNAYQVGRAGHYLNPVCPVDDNLATLEKANLRGIYYHELEERIDRLEDERDELIDKLQRLRSGDTLHFNDQQAAENYMYHLPNRINWLEMQILQERMDLHHYPIYYP